MRLSERNRYQNSVTVSNIGLASILSDPFGKSATAIMKEVLSSTSVNELSIKKLIHGTCAKKTDAILASLKDSHIESDQSLKMNTAYKHMQELDKHIETLEIEMMKRCSPLLDSFHHITKLPGISMITAMIIIS